MIKLQFIGGIRSVTGSSYLIKTDTAKILIDCGMFQGIYDGERRNYLPFPFTPPDIDAVLLTHSHIDHSGLIPKLVKEGYRGKVLATKATVDLCGIMLLDSAHIQGVDCDVMLEVAPNIEVRFRDAGHILGSTIIELWVREKGRKIKVVFSGDLGHKGVPIVKDPTYIDEANYLLIESTYGNRQHKGIKETIDEFAEEGRETLKRGGNVIIPSFAVGRTQDILYILNQLSREGRLNHLNVFIDSHLATNATRIFLKHPECFDKETLELISKGQFPKG